MKRLLSPCLAIAGAWALCGCPNFATMQTANAIGKGRTQFAVEPGFQTWMPPPAGWPSGVPGWQAPTMSFAFRYGVTDSVDVGARIGQLAGTELIFKFQFTDPEDQSFVFSVNRASAASSFSAWARCPCNCPWSSALASATATS